MCVCLQLYKKFLRGGTLELDKKTKLSEKKIIAMAIAAIAEKKGISPKSVTVKRFIKI